MVISLGFPWLFSFLSTEGLVEFALLDQNGLRWMDQNGEDQWGITGYNPIPSYEMPIRWALKMNKSNTKLGCIEGHFRAIGAMGLMYAAIINNIHQDLEETIFMYL